MERQLHFSKLILTVGVTGILMGCGGGDKDGGTTQEQPSGTEGTPEAGGNASADPANKPKVTKFTPEMVKAAMEAIWEQLPNLQTKKERDEQRARMMKPGSLQATTDKLNENISGGGIDFHGLKVDAITVEALTKGMVAHMPKAKKKADVVKRINNAKVLCILLQANSDENEGKLPAFDEWCDAILRDMDTLAVFYSPQHPDTAKLKAALPNEGVWQEPQPNDDAISPPKDADDATPTPKETAKRKLL